MFFFSPDISVYVFFGGYLGLKGPHIFGEERKKQHSYNARQGPIKHVFKFQGLTLIAGVDIWTFVQLSTKITAWHRNYLVSALIRFLAFNLTSYWS